MASRKNERSGVRVKLGAFEFVFSTSAPPDRLRSAKIIVPILVAFLGCSGAIAPPFLGLAFSFLTSKPSSAGGEPDRIAPDAPVRKESRAPEGKKAGMPGKPVQLKQTADTSKNAQPSSEPVSPKPKDGNSEPRPVKATAAPALTPAAAPIATKTDAKAAVPSTLGSATKSTVDPPVRLPSIFMVKYRCLGSYTKKTDGQSARIVAAHLNVLGIPWRGQDFYTPQGFYWYTVISYGGRVDWLERGFLDEFEARAFASALQAEGLQATICPK